MTDPTLTEAQIAGALEAFFGGPLRPATIDAYSASMRAALLAAAKAGERADGANYSKISKSWKLVPIDPTRDMIDAWRQDQSQLRSLETSYRALLSAAPKAPIAEGDAYERGRRDENEACAKVADSSAYRHNREAFLAEELAAKKIANAIRARIKEGASDE